MTYLIDTEKFRVSYYTGKLNLRKYGTVYVKVIEGKEVKRKSTGIKVKGEYWEEGKINLRRCNRIDLREHREKDIKLNQLITEIEEVYINTGKVGGRLEGIITEITGMKQKRKSSIKLTTLMEGCVLDNGNLKSQNSLLPIVGKFKGYLKLKGVEDKPESLTTDLMRKYREWLLTQPITTRRAKDLFNYIFTLAGKIERKHGISFDDLNKNKIQPIEIGLKQSERLRGIALTGEEIKRLEGLKLSGTKERFRDYFLLQCFTGVRMEDLTLLLNKDNFREIEGKPYVIFNNQKTGTECIIPLTGLFGDITNLWNKRAGGGIKGGEEMNYNRVLKEIAKEGGLNREIKKTEERGGVKKEITNPLFSVISSHSGRHTFITNCQRDLNLSPAQIKKITGHSTTALIEKTYTNTTTEDNVKSLLIAINPVKLTESVNGEERKKPERGLEGLIREICNLIGIEIKRDVSLIDLLNRIERRKGEIIRKYGEATYKKLKNLLSIGKSEEDRKRIEVIFCKALGRKIKVKF